MTRARAIFLACAFVGLSSLLASQAESGSPVVGRVDLRSARLSSSDGQSHSVRHENGSQQSAPLKRIVSASLLSDELLHGILPWGAWAGVSYVVDWPSASPLHGTFPQEIPRTSGTSEDLLARDADLIVLSPYNNALTALQLKRAGQNVHILRPSRTFEELFIEYRRLGAAIRRRDAVDVRIAKLQAELALHSGDKQEEGNTALLLQGMFSYGPDTLIHECLERAGFHNVLSRDDFGTNPKLNVEHLLTLDPLVIFVAADVAEPRRAAPSELNGAIPWQALRATRRGHVFLVPGACMSSISHHALGACRAFSRVHKELRL